MKLENFTPFPNLRFFASDATGREFGVLLVKGTYKIRSDGTLTPARIQEPLSFTDDYEGEVNLSSLRMPSDIVPKKPRADVILRAEARAPGGKPLASWIVAVRVEGRHVLEKRLRVTGPRRWEPQWGVSAGVLETLSPSERRRAFAGWRLGDPEPATSIPIRYEAAFGGLQDKRSTDSDAPFFVADERNPIGCGWLDCDAIPSEHPVPAPQIEAADDPIGEPFQDHVPVGFGAIPPAWLPRRPLGGTFDQNWIDTIWPDWPPDYSYGYHQSAHPDLIYPEHLTGEETVRLTGLGGQGGERVIRLPGHMVIAELERHDGEIVCGPMELDTLLIDVADEDPARHRVHLSWRISFAHGSAQRLAAALVTPEDLLDERSVA